MRQAEVYRNETLAGILIEESRKSYIFRYDDKYIADFKNPSVSLTLPKSKQEYHSEYLFPFFFNLLSEGENKKLQCNQYRIDEEDYFGLLLATAQYDTIGAVTIKAKPTE